MTGSFLFLLTMRLCLSSPLLPPFVSSSPIYIQFFLRTFLYLIFLLSPLHLPYSDMLLFSFLPLYAYAIFHPSLSLTFLFINFIQSSSYFLHALHLILSSTFLLLFLQCLTPCLFFIPSCFLLLSSTCRCYHPGTPRLYRLSRNL